MRPIQIAFFLVSIIVLLGAATPGLTQEATTTTIRTPELRRDALFGGDIVPRSGERIEDGIILLADGVIVGVGAGIAIPPD